MGVLPALSGRNDHLHILPNASEDPQLSSMAHTHMGGESPTHAQRCLHVLLRINACIHQSRHSAQNPVVLKAPSG